MTEAVGRRKVESGIDIVAMAKEELVFATNAFFVPLTILVDRLNQQVKKIEREPRPDKVG